MACSRTHCFKIQLTAQYNLNCFIYADVFSRLSLILEKITMSAVHFCSGATQEVNTITC